MKISALKSIKTGLLCASLLVLVLAGCTPKPASGLEQVVINLTYIPNIQFAPIYVAIENGYFREEGLDVSVTYGNESDLIALLGSGKQEFMIASAEQVLLSRAQGVPVLTVLDWYQDYPVGVASMTSAGIQSPQDMAGKAIGLPGLYGASYIGFEALAQYAGLSDSDYELRSIGFTQVESLVSGSVDAVVVYLANEPAQLRALGYKIDVIPVADYLDLVSNGLVTSESLAAQNPERVRKIVSAFSRGIDFTVQNPDTAYELCKAHIENLESADTALQKQVLAASIALWNQEDSKQSKLARWENMQNALLEIGLLKNPIDLEGAFSNAFLP